MTSDMVVVWDGAHHGQDLDLLGEGVRVSEKVLGETRTQYGSVRGVVLEALPTMRGRAMTLRELEAVTGIGGQSITGVLYKLRQEGTLLSETAPGTSRLRGTPRLYWRRAV